MPEVEFADAGEDEEPLRETLCRVKMTCCGKGWLSALNCVSCHDLCEYLCCIDGACLCVITTSNASCMHALLHHSVHSCCTLLCLASRVLACLLRFPIVEFDGHGFTCCGCLMFDVAIALLFLLFCHPGPAKVFCLIDVRCAQCTCHSLRGAVGTACLHVCAFVCTRARVCFL